MSETLILRLQNRTLETSGWHLDRYFHLYIFLLQTTNRNEESQGVGTYSTRKDHELWPGHSSDRVQQPAQHKFSAIFTEHSSQCSTNVFLSEGAIRQLYPTASYVSSKVFFVVVFWGIWCFSARVCRFTCFWTQSQQAPWGTAALGTSTLSPWWLPRGTDTEQRFWFIT